MVFAILRFDSYRIDSQVHAGEKRNREGSKEKQKNKEEPREQTRQNLLVQTLR